MFENAYHLKMPEIKCVKTPFEFFFTSLFLCDFFFIDYHSDYVVPSIFIIFFTAVWNCLDLCVAVFIQQ